MALPLLSLRRFRGRMMKNELGLLAFDIDRLLRGDQSGDKEARPEAADRVCSAEAEAEAEA